MNKNLVQKTALNPKILPFLTTDGSLTALLEAKAGQPIKVVIIKEVLAPLTFFQKKQLKLPLNKPALAKVREVLLYGNDKHAWVQATSVLPLGSLVGDAKRLKRLKNTPIGYVMFKKNKKLPFERTIFFDKTAQHWARQTVYDWCGRRLLIEERFLFDE